MFKSKRIRMWLALVAMAVLGGGSNLSYSQTTATNLLQPADLVYKGAFLLPTTGIGGSSWAYGGGSLTYKPVGDPTGPNDGYPGSLLGVGHPWQKAVSEITIPVPVISPTKSAADLNRAASLQPFGDVTGGLKDQVPVDGQGNVGVMYFPKMGNQTSDKLYWVAYQSYNVNAVDFLSTGWAEQTLADPQAKGLWHIGTYHAMATSRYLMEIPQSWADVNAGGKYIGGGRNREAGCCGSSKGPALFAFAPWANGNPPVAGSSVDAKQLLFYSAYPNDNTLPGGFQPRGAHSFPGYQACDDWSGGAWVTTAANKSALLFVGRKSLGTTRYGNPLPTDSDQTYGYHCDPFEPQILFYNPDDIAAVAKGTKDPGDPVPYAVLKPAQYFWPSTAWHMGGVAYDRARGLLYVVQTLAYYEGCCDSYPIVHVFSVGQGTTTNTGTGSGTPQPPTPPPPPPTPTITSTGPLVAPKALQVR